MHRWAIEAGFDVLRADADHPHYLTGEHKGFWGWTFREAGTDLVKEGTMTEARYNELTEGMRMADDDPSTLVAHARTHQTRGAQAGATALRESGCQRAAGKELHFSCER